MARFLDFQGRFLDAETLRSTSKNILRNWTIKKPIKSTIYKNEKKKINKKDKGEKNRNFSLKEN